MNQSESITIGWKVNRGLDPEYWLRPDANLSKSEPEDYISVPVKKIDSHTAIIAQSGSGKSFFLGKFLEEIAIKTKANLLILDPNGDFLKIDELADSKLWQNIKYDSSERRGFLPTEDYHKFKAKWDLISKKIRTINNPDSPSEKDILQLSWESLSPDFLTTNYSSLTAIGIEQCHRFLQLLFTLVKDNQNIDIGESKYWLLTEAEKTLTALRKHQGDDEFSESFIKTSYKTEKLVEDRTQRRIEEFKNKNTSGDEKLMAEYYKLLENTNMSEIITNLITFAKYVDESVTNVYFGQARQIVSQGTFNSNPEQHSQEDQNLPRIDVVDLSSLTNPEDRRLCVSSIITEEFNRLRNERNNALQQPDSDSRTPTFLVIDEAHNLVPSGELTAPQRALRDQFRTIAAEGRKFGFFLILVTQRPDKLDSLVVSECENRAVMKLGSQSILNTTRQILGLEDIPSKTLDKILEFDVGRGMIYGRWTENSARFFYSGARSTAEGGKNLPIKHWGSPEDSISNIKY